MQSEHAHVLQEMSDFVAVCNRLLGELADPARSFGARADSTITAANVMFPEVTVAALQLWVPHMRAGSAFGISMAFGGFRRARR